jgi:hypothetical protein
MDSTEVNTPDAGESRVAGKRANARLAPNQRKRSLDLISDSSRSCDSIELPPISGLVDFCRSAASDADRERLTQARLRRRERRFSPETASPRCVSSIA